MGDCAARVHPVSQVAADAVVTAGRSLIAIATRSLGAAAGDIAVAQWRALVVLVSRGPQRMVELAGALGVTPSTASRMCGRLVRKGLIRRHRARGDRRAVLVSVTGTGRLVVDQDVAVALRAFAVAAGEVPDCQLPAAMPAERAAWPVPRQPVKGGENVNAGTREPA